jgi:hypothetical protein
MTLVPVLMILYMKIQFHMRGAGADTAVSMLLLLTAVTQAALALTDKMLITDQLHTVLFCRVSHRDTSHQEDFSSCRCNAQNRTSPAELSVTLGHRGTICRL